MEDVLSIDLDVWPGRPARSRMNEWCVQRPAKIAKCRNIYVHSLSYPARSAATNVAEWHRRRSAYTAWIANPAAHETLPRNRSSAKPAAANCEARFRKIAEEWSREVSNLSSVDALTSHPKYRQIVQLGWEVVPFLLADLRANRGFWFTALYEITGIRPFDPSDAGNSRRMTEAWVRWGKRKGLI